MRMHVSLARLVFAIGSIVLSVGLIKADEKPDLEKLVSSQKGKLPIIISAPHDGTLSIPGVQERTGFGVNQFVTVRDSGASQIASGVAKELEKLLDAKPYLVVANFSRKYIDANRKADDAYEWKAAKPVYDHFHKQLADAKDEVTKSYGRGIVIDFHQQGADSLAIYRGTNNRKTVTHMIDRFGEAGLTGPKSILGVLEKKGHKIIPACDSKDNENPSFSGGYISQTYGSKDGGQVDAIQFEMGSSFRKKENIEKTTKDIAEAVAVYAKEYLKLKP